MKQRKRPQPQPEPRERDDIRVAAHRCPYCHDDVAVVAHAVLCMACQARHHEDCWDEGGRCSGCGHDMRLIPELKAATPPTVVSATRGSHMLIPLRRVWKTGGHTIVCEASYFTGRESVWVDGVLVSDTHNLSSMTGEHKVPIGAQNGLLFIKFVVSFTAILYVDAEQLEPLNGKAAREAFQATLSEDDRESLRSRRRVALQIAAAFATVILLLATIALIRVGVIPF